MQDIVRAQVDQHRTRLMEEAANERLARQLRHGRQRPGQAAWSLLAGLIRRGRLLEHAGSST